MTGRARREQTRAEAFASGIYTPNPPDKGPNGERVDESAVMVTRDVHPEWDGPSRLPDRMREDRVEIRCVVRCGRKVACADWHKAWVWRELHTSATLELAHLAFVHYSEWQR